MSDVTPPESDRVDARSTATVDLPVPPSSDPSAGEQDPLGHLYKMSTTAGLGTQEYVAVNNTAVFAVILGLASALSIMANVLLVIPIAGAICAIMAFRQIERSNGTQTGKFLAGAGLMLSLGFIGFVGTREATEASRTQADRDAIAALIQQFGQELRDEKFGEAYALFSPKFHSRVSETEFTNRIRGFASNSLYGNLKETTTNGLANFDIEPSTGARFAEANIIFSYDKLPDQPRQGGIFHKIGSQWMIEDIPELFPPPNQQAQ